MEKTKNQNKTKNEIFDWLEAMTFALVTIIIIFTFFFRIVVIKGDSMQTTLHPDERVILNSIFYTPKQGDIIVVYKADVNGGEPIIKRIIATEGQEINYDYESNTTYINGEKFEEDYVLDDPESTLIGNVEFPVTVPPGCVFVMGDNRDHSLDSRRSSVGMVELNEIKGHAIFRVFPLDRFGSLRK